MAYSTTVPILAGLAIVGSLTGVSIGRSTIAQINPVYFQPAPGHFYGEMVPNRGLGQQQPADTAGADYLQADYAYSADPGCGACNDYPVEYRPRHDRAIEAVDEARSTKVAVEPVLASETEWRDEPAPANRGWIERYTNYEVATVQVEPVAAEAQVQPES